MHSVKINRNFVVPPLLRENDLVYINGEIAYERFTSGSETISSPQIFAKKVYRLENNSDPADLEQLHKGKRNRCHSIAITIVVPRNWKLVRFLIEKPYQDDSCNVFNSISRLCERSEATRSDWK